MSFEWTCPFCGRDTTITEGNSASNAAIINTDNFDIRKYVRGDYVRCPNEKCHKYTLTVSAGDAVFRGPYPEYKQKHVWKLIPESNAKPYPEYIALTTFLKVAESALQEASEIEDYQYEQYILFRIAKFEYGQWVVRQEILDAVRSQLRAAYAVAVAA